MYGGTITPSILYSVRSILRRRIKDHGFFSAYSGDDELLLKHFAKAKAMADWLIARRTESLQVRLALSPVAHLRPAVAPIRRIGSYTCEKPVSESERETAI